MGFADPVLLDGLKSAAVISSGFILSKNVVRELVKLRQPQCPETRERLNPIDSDKYYILLPQVDAALKDFRSKRDIHELKSAEVTLKLLISGNKFRIIINSQNDANPHKLLESFLSTALPDEHSNLSSQESTSYKIENFGRCWRVNNEETRLEFWFQKAVISDDHVNRIIEALLEPLHLQENDDSDYGFYQSIHELQPRIYCNAIEDTVMNGELARQCCENFLMKTQEITTELNVTLDDKVTFIQDETQLPPAQHRNGIVFFQNPTQSIGRRRDSSTIGNTASQPNTLPRYI